MNMVNFRQRSQPDSLLEPQRQGHDAVAVTQCEKVDCRGPLLLWPFAACAIISLSGYLFISDTARAAHLPTADAIIAQAQAGARDGSAHEMAVLDALIGRLRTSRNPVEQIKLIDAIGMFGKSDGDSAADVKSRLRDTGSAAMLAVIRSDADWSARGEALTRLQNLDPPDDVLRQAIAAARTDKGDHAGFIVSRAAALENWRLTRPITPDQPPLSSQELQQRAIALLKRRGIEANDDALASAIGIGKPELVADLLTAGVEVGPDNAKRAYDAVLSGMSSACGEHSVPIGKVADALSAVVGRGFDLSHTDEMGNTILISAAQFCSAPIVERLVALGAAVNVSNKQRFGPLQMSLVTGKWEVARILIDHGARLTRQQVDQIFFEAPQIPDQRKLLQRATR